MAETPAEGGPAASEALATDVLGTALRAALVGPSNVGAPAVVWSDRGSQLLLHVDKLQVRTATSTLIVAVDTESVEFGVVPLIVRFILGDPKGPAPLVASSDPTALGHPQVAARWGTLFRDVVWAALARLVDQQAKNRSMVPGSMEIGPQGLRLNPQPAFDVADLAVEHVRGLIADGARLPGPVGGGRR